MAEQTISDYDNTFSLRPNRLGGCYTIFGGLRAVIYTDFLQAFILIGGGIILTLLLLREWVDLVRYSKEFNQSSSISGKVLITPIFPGLAFYLGHQFRIMVLVY
jgi:Na+/proline symporter